MTGGTPKHRLGRSSCGAPANNSLQASANIRRRWFHVEHKRNHPDLRAWSAPVSASKRMPGAAAALLACLGLALATAAEGRAPQPPAPKFRAAGEEAVEQAAPRWWLRGLAARRPRSPIGVAKRLARKASLRPRSVSAPPRPYCYRGDNGPVTDPLPSGPCSYEVLNPTSGAAPKATIMIIAGGGWRGASSYVSIGQVRQFGKVWRDAGFQTIAVELTSAQINGVGKLGAYGLRGHRPVVRPTAVSGYALRRAQLSGLRRRRVVERPHRPASRRRPPPSMHCHGGRSDRSVRSQGLREQQGLQGRRRGLRPVRTRPLEPRELCESALFRVADRTRSSPRRPARPRQPDDLVCSGAARRAELHRHPDGRSYPPAGVRQLRPLPPAVLRPPLLRGPARHHQDLVRPLAHPRGFSGRIRPR